MSNIKISEILDVIPEIYKDLDRKSNTYNLFDNLCVDIISNSNLTKRKKAIINLGKFGLIDFPFQEFGAINSLDLFGLDELILFSFYFSKKDHYKNVSDLGANIGLHSIIMSKLGWNVECYEPDPVHMEILKNNLKINSIKNVNPVQMAISDKQGELEFVRVKGNTTSSHLAGSKVPYGEIEKFKVQVESIKNVINKSDFIKMDVEGIEDKIITSTTEKDWLSTDMMLEVGNEKNANLIFNHLNKINVNCFSQKNQWGIVKDVSGMPYSYREGSLFITIKKEFKW